MTTADSAGSATEVKVILRSRDDWAEWYEVIKDHAEKQGVWEYFDPDGNDETRPDPPARPRVPPEIEVTEDVYQSFQKALQSWKGTQDAIISTKEAIRGSVALHIRRFIAGEEPYEMLRILKKLYEPSDLEADLGALKKYNTVISRPIRQGKISAWLNNFESAYLAIRRRNLPESNDRHVKRQFLAAISAVSYSFADRQFVLMVEPTYEKEDFHSLLGRYRANLDYTKGFKTRTTSMESTTFHGQNDGALNSTKSNTKRNPCVCGKNHAYSNCWYIINSKRPTWWKPNKKTEAKVSEAIAKDDKLGRKLKALMERDVQQNKDKDQKESNQTDEHYVMELVSSAGIPYC